MLFEIEAVLEVAGAGVVVARELEAGDFRLGEASTLGGRRIHSQVSAPRALTESGKPRMDLFAFQFRSKSDAQALSSGQVVDLLEE